MLLIDRKYLLKIKFNTMIHKIKQLIRIHDIDNKLHDNSKYIEFDFYVVDTLSNQSSLIIHFRREIHLIDNLKAHVLFDVDILKSTQIIFEHEQTYYYFFRLQ